jgi:hypothetical protein
LALLRLSHFARRDLRLTDDGLRFLADLLHETTAQQVEALLELAHMISGHTHCAMSLADLHRRCLAVAHRQPPSPPDLYSRGEIQTLLSSSIDRLHRIANQNGLRDAMRQARKAL